MPDITVTTESAPTPTTTSAPAISEIIEIAKTSGENSAGIENLEEKTEDLEDKTIALENQMKWAGTDIALFNDRLYALESRVETLEAKERIEEENIEGIHEGGAETEIEEREEKIPRKREHNFFY